MKKEELKDLQIGQKIYVPVIYKNGGISCGNKILGSYVFYKYKLYHLKIEDIQYFDYGTPEGEESFWRYNYDAYCIKFDLSSLSEEEIENFKFTYSQRHPVIHRMMYDDTDKFDGYFEIPVKKPNEYADDVLEMMSVKKIDAYAVLNKINKNTLDYIKNEIDILRKCYADVKKWLKEDR